MLNGKGIADAELLNLLADFGPLAISEVVTHLEVTRTAVHERLLRLMAEGLVDRCVLRGGRGRPSYRYTVSHKARKLAGNNFADLAGVLWQEMFGVEDSKLRGRVKRRIVRGLKVLYQDEIQGTTLEARMESLRELLDEKRRVRCDVDTQSALPTLTLRDCPYVDLAEVDNTICQIETMLFSQLLGDDVVLSQCRLDGHPCCKFRPNRKRTTRKAQVTV